MFNLERTIRFWNNHRQVTLSQKIGTQNKLHVFTIATIARPKQGH